MSFIRTDWVAFDTNEFIYAIRHTSDRLPSVELVYSLLYDVRLFVPYQVFKELSHNLTVAEETEFQAVARTAQDLHLSFTPAPSALVEVFENRGAKRGDARIAAELELAGIKWLISENRHFLSEITDLPFTVLSASEALEMLR